MPIHVESPYKNYAFWYKGQTHVHSDVADGTQQAYNVEKTYHDYGYDFICLTDHICAWFAQSHPPTPDPMAFRILHIVSAEDGWQERFHMIILGINLDQARWYHDNVDKNVDSNMNGICNASANDESKIQARIDYALAIGELPILAHPKASYTAGPVGWGCYTYRQDLLLNNSRYAGIEIYTGGTCSADWWDPVLRLGKDRVAWGLAADDNEDPENRSSFNRGWIVVNSDEGPAPHLLDGPREYVLRQSILQNIRDGNFYAVVRSPGTEYLHGYGIPDRGPAMDITVSGSTIAVLSDPGLPCEEIRFLPNGIVTPEFCAQGVISSHYEVRGDEIYVRIEIDQIRQDGELYRAYSQPLYVTNQ